MKRNTSIQHAQQLSLLGCSLQQVDDNPDGTVSVGFGNTIDNKYMQMSQIG